MFDGSFHLIRQARGVGFRRPAHCPLGYSPFGIQNVGGHIFVAYAKQRRRPAKTRSPGRGSASSTSTSTDRRLLLARVASHGRAQRALGHRHGARERLRPAVRHADRRQLRRRPTERVPRRTRQASGCTSTSSVGRTATPSRSRGSVGIGFGNGGQRRSHDHRCSSRPGSTTRHTASSARSPRRAGDRPRDREREATALRGRHLRFSIHPRWAQVVRPTHSPTARPATTLS